MTRDECLDAAGEVYGAILADPERRAELRAHRAAMAAEATETPGAQVAGGAISVPGPKPRRAREARCGRPDRGPGSPRTRPGQGDNQP